MSRLHNKTESLRLQNSRADLEKSGYVKGRISVVDASTDKEVVGLDFNAIMPQHIRSFITIEDEWEPIDE